MNAWTYKYLVPGAVARHQESNEIVKVIEAPINGPRGKLYLVQSLKDKSKRWFSRKQFAKYKLDPIAAILFGDRC